MAAAAAAAEAPAAVVLLGKHEVALGRVVKIAGPERLGGKGGEARVGRHREAKILPGLGCIFELATPTGSRSFSSSPGLFTMKYILLLATLLPLARPALAQQPASATSAAPADQSVLVASSPAEASAALRAFDKHIAPAVKQGRATLPQAKHRFLQGLPAGQTFFVTTRLTDPDGTYEQVFVRVQRWQEKQVTGLIANEVGTVKNFQQNQQITFPESAVLDWTISHPDGTEEGNYIGKLLDAEGR